MKKKATSRKRRSPAKSGVTHKTVEEYIAAVPEPSRSALLQIRDAIRSVMPAGSVEIISYRIPAFKHRKVLVWYAAFSDHCSLFPTAAVIEEFKDDLKDFRTSKGTIHFSLQKAVPVELIKKLVKSRVKRSDNNSPR